MAVKKIRTVLIGLGNVNLGWLKIIQQKEHFLQETYQIQFLVVGVADSSGVAVNIDGWNPEVLITHKTQKKRVSDLPGFIPGVKTEMIPQHVNAELLIESSPGNISNGEPGLSTVRMALSKGWSVVLANKTPLLFGMPELMKLSAEKGGGLAFSATVCGGLPVINVLQRDLKAANIKSIKGVFNATSNFVLQELERGGTIDQAIAEAQRLGAAEADPSHDLHGHDTANKLFIIMKSCAGFKGSIQDIHVEGIEGITPEKLGLAIDKGRKIKLVAEAVLINDQWKLKVSPAEVPAHSFIGSCDGWEMGIEIETDLYDKIYLKNFEADPVGTSAAVLRDAIDLSVK